MPTVLTREHIKEAKDTQIEFIAMPEWSPDDPEGGFFIRGLSGTDRDDFDMAMIVERQDPKRKGRKTQEVNLKNLRAKLVARTAVDSDDPDTCKPIFTPADVEWLGRKSGAALQRAFAVAQRLSGLGADDIEELTAELGNDQSSDSGEGSPLPSESPMSLLSSSESAATSSPNGSPSTDSSPSGTDD